MEEEKVNKIEEISESLQTEKPELHEEPKRAAPDRDQFDALMNLENQRAQTQPAAIDAATANKPSLLDEVRNINHKVDLVSRASPHDIVSQAKSVIAQIEDVKTKLATPDLDLKTSVQSMLRNKLSHIDESLKIALNRAGLEYTPQVPTAATTLANPIERFVGLLTNGQYQLQRLAADIEHLGKLGPKMTPADMLAVQLKVGYVQQELELFANLLNKSLESIKTIMNVQV